MKYRKLMASLLLTSAVYASGPCAAAQSFFFGEDVASGALPAPNSTAAQTSFLSNLIGVRVENFDSLAVGTNFPLNITFGADTATLSGTNIVTNTGIQDAAIAGRFAISGTQYLNVGTSDAGSFKLTFTTPQAAFGFFATDIGDFSGQLGISFDGGTAIAVNHTLSAPNGNALFWGIIDTVNLFSTIEFINMTGEELDDAFGFDDFTIGRAEQVRPIPLPGTLALLGLGISALALIRRKRS